MMLFAYFNQDGSARAVASMQADFPDEQVFEAIVPANTEANHIYLDVEAVEVKWKTPFEVTIGLNRISGLPEGTRVTISEGSWIVDDGELHLDANIDELKLAHLEHPHFIAQYVEIPTGPEEA